MQNAVIKAYWEWNMNNFRFSSCCKIRISIYLESLLSSWAVSCYWQCSVSLIWDDELFIHEPIISRILLLPKVYECALGLVPWTGSTPWEGIYMFCVTVIYYRISDWWVCCVILCFYAISFSVSYFCHCSFQFSFWSISISYRFFTDLAVSLV